MCGQCAQADPPFKNTGRNRLAFVFCSLRNGLVLVDRVRMFFVAIIGRKYMSAKAKASNVSRRKFLKGGAVASGAAAATIAFPQVSRAATTTLKMQSSWGAKAIFQDMAK